MRQDGDQWQATYQTDALLRAVVQSHGLHRVYDGPTDLTGSLTIVRRSLDARKKLKSPKFQYVVDIRLEPAQLLKLKWRHQPGQLERQEKQEPQTATDEERNPVPSSSEDDNNTDQNKKKKVLIVGAGPAGLFCALHLLWKSNGRVLPVIVERGQAVEQRGKDIGALIHRHILNKESNFAFGEGGAGTWSDGKLTTRIGRNSNSVRKVLSTLVDFGAPSNILVEGAPHLGTDNLVRLLRNMRTYLIEQGAEIHFGTSMKSLELDPKDGSVQSVHVVSTTNTTTSTTTSTIMNDTVATVLATGHSARDVYESLYESGVTLEPKGFAVGFRIEHPQRIINQIQYDNEWGPTVTTGKATTDQLNQEYFMKNDNGETTSTTPQHQGRLPVPSYRLATDKAKDGTTNNSTRGVYSFCMCPGGQIVPSSTVPEELCVNGMSFSQRDAPFANSALVVTVNVDDPILTPYTKTHGRVMAGVAFQRDMEQKAALLGGGNWTVPVQRMTDFCQGVVSETIPPSSYRLGVTSAPCHDIYPAPITAALRDALQNHFNTQMKGYYCDEGLLHAVETRTSSPLRICRDPETLKAVGTSNLFPAGEGAGFAGGIVSAAVDGMAVADAVLEELYGTMKRSSSSSKKHKKKQTSIGFSY